MVDTSGKRWPIIQDILRKEGIAKQHINSFNEFLESGLQSIIKEVSIVCKLNLHNCTTYSKTCRYACV